MKIGVYIGDCLGEGSSRRRRQKERVKGIS
jgi:hypothetical protein